MTSGVNFWDTGIWSFVITLTLLFAAMMVANILRNVIRPLRKLMIPSSVLGGFILLLANGIFTKITGNSMYQYAVLESLTYHGLGLGFVAMTLRNIDKQDKSHKMDSFDAGVTVVCTYLLQAVLGLAITVILYKVMNSFFASGILLPMGYGQGPGQCYNWGHTYEMSYGFDNGTSFGLTVAAMGFVAASIGGVIYLNVLRKRGVFSGEQGANVKDHNLTAETITGQDEIPLSESMDKFTVQLALVFISYIIAFAFMKGVNVIIETGALGDFGKNTVQPLLWGFNFLFGTLAAMLVKGIIRGLKKKGVIKREYTNNFMQDRISGVMFDLMVVASIAAIKLTAFRYKEFVVPLLAICVLGGVVTYIYLDFICKRVYPDYRHEAFLSLYGMLTGTASTGVILLREMDPKFETQAANNLVYHQPWAIVFGFPMLLLLGVAPKSMAHTLATLGILIALFVVMNVISLRKSIFKKKIKK